MERERILADFQACTGNECFEECITILDQHNWDLLQALQATMSEPPVPTEDISPPLEMPAHPPPVYQSAEVAGPPSFSYLTGDFSSQDTLPSMSEPGSALYEAGPAGFVHCGAQGASSSAATSRPPARLLNFTIEYRDRNIKLRVPDAETVGKLKELLEAEVCVKPSKQELRGWVSRNDQSVHNTDVLRDLNLPLDNTLFLLTPSLGPSNSASTSSGYDEDAVIAERLSQSFSLDITHKDTGKKYRLNVPGNKTIQEVKYDVYAMTDVPVRHQSWSGWPDNSEADDTLTIAGSRVGYPCHELQMSSSNVSETKKTDSLPHKVLDVDEESDEDFEDAQDTGYMESMPFDSEDSIQSQRPQHLMPEDVADETEALQCFSDQFRKRYGECHPVFYIGELESAIKDALHCQARERKLVAIYLHHDSSIVANVFCDHILCSESVVSYLSNNFVTWAWDLTSPANKARLLTLCTRQFGNVAASKVRDFVPDELPLLLLISRTRGFNEVVQVIHANTTLDGLMTELIQAVEVFNEQQTGEMREEDERRVRETMLAEQDAAYQESLATDRAKAEAKLREEEEKRRVEEKEENKRRNEEREKRRAEERKEAERQSLESQLPEEPPAQCSQPVTTLRFRCPQGRTECRRFLAHNPLQILLNYVSSLGFLMSEYKVLTTFPRRDLTLEDTRRTLQELNLYPQETLILEEK